MPALLLGPLVRNLYKIRALQGLTSFLSSGCRLFHAPYPCPGVVYIMCIGSPLYPGRKVYRDILNSILLTTSSCPISRCVSLFCRKLSQQSSEAQPVQSYQGSLMRNKDMQKLCHALILACHAGHTD